MSSSLTREQRVDQLRASLQFHHGTPPPLPHSSSKSINTQSISSLPGSNMQPGTQSLSASKDADLGVPKRRASLALSVQPTTGTSQIHGNPLEEFQYQNQFLKESVHRLSVELAAYQAKYPTLDPNDISTQVSQALGATKDDPLPSWLIHAPTLAPLLTAYDSRIRDLEDTKHALQSETTRLRHQCEQLIQENNQLHAEQQQLLTQMVAQKSSKSVTTAATGEDEALLERVQLLTKEADLLRAQAREQQSALQRAHDDASQRAKELYAVQQRCIQLQQSNDAIAQEMRDALDAVAQQHRQSQQSQHERDTIQQQRDTLLERCSQLESLERESSHQLHAAQSQLSQLSMRLQDQEGLYEQLKKDHLQLEQTWKSKVHAYDALHVKYTQVENDLHRLQTDHAELVQASHALEQRLSARQSDETDQYQLVQSREEQVESALLERDKALAIERQTSEELARLQKFIESSQLRWRERTDTELNQLRHQFQGEKVKLEQELTALHTKYAESVEMMQRAQRDHRSLAQAYQHLASQPATHHQQLLQQCDHLAGQLRACERERDELQHELDNRVLEARRELQHLQGEHTVLLGQHQTLYERCRRAESEQESLQAKVSVLLEQVTTLERSLQQSEQARAQSERVAGVTLGTTVKRYETALEEWRIKDQVWRDRVDTLEHDLRQLHSKQQGWTDKWKDESHRLTHDYTQLIKKEHDKVLLLERELWERQRDLDSTRDRLEQVTQQLNEAQQGNQQWRQSLQSNETRIAQLSNQVQGLLGEQNQWREEKRRLLREVDRERMRVARMASNGPRSVSPMRRVDSHEEDSLEAEIARLAIEVPL